MPVLYSDHSGLKSRDKLVDWLKETLDKIETRYSPEKNLRFTAVHTPEWLKPYFKKNLRILFSRFIFIRLSGLFLLSFFPLLVTLNH